MRKYILCLLTIVSFNLHAQYENHKQGEIIVELNTEDTSIIEHQLSKSGIETLEVKPISEYIDNLFLVNIEQKNDIDKVSSLLLRNEHVVRAQKNRLLSLRSTLPDDPLIKEQWQYSNSDNQEYDFQIDRAWDITTGGLTPQGDTIVIAIIDNGFDLEHEDLRPNLWQNRSEIPNNGIDDDNNGYVDDIFGWNAYDNNGNVNNKATHGTSVAGIVGAKGDNNTGVSGVNWNVKLMLIRGGGSEADAIAAYAYPLAMRKLYNETNGQQGAYVVATNSSWGIDNGFADESPLWCDFYDIMGEQGILSIAATANSQINVEKEGDLPSTCKSDYLIATTNLNSQEALNYNAAYGPKSIDIAAYGENTYTIKPNNKYGSFGGTSAASPHVAGTVGLLYAADCKIGALNYGDQARYVKDMLLNSFTELEELKDKTTTGGKLNIGLAVTNASNSCSNDCAENVAIKIITEEQQFKVNFSNRSQTKIRYRKATDNDFTIIDEYVSGTPIQTEFCSEYIVQVYSHCNDRYGYSRYFTSGGCCENPTTQSFLENQEIFIKLNNVSEDDDFYIDYRLKGYEWNTIEVKGTDSKIKLPFSELEECGIYEYRIKKDCKNFEIEYSEISTVYSHCGICTDNYCEYKGLTNESEFIEKLTLDNNIIINRTLSSPVYDYFYDPSYILKDSIEIPISVDIGYKDVSYNENLYVYIDSNYDMIFDDKELYYVDKAFKNNSTGTLKLPILEDYKKTRMRIIMGFGLPEQSCKDNSEKKYGDLIDLCIELKSNIVSTDEINYGAYSIAPNPSNTLNIKGDNIEYITIVNSYGSIVYSGIYKPNNEYDFPSGVYSIIVNTNNTHFRLTWIKI